MSKARLSNWGSWQQTRNAIAVNLGYNIESRNNAAPGSDAEKLYSDNIDALLDSMKVHALSGLRQVDLEIANSTLLKEIEAASREIKKETDRIKDATERLDDLTRLVKKLAKLVGLFSGL
ncbi:hypothetical protein CEP88_06940 [Roseobacter denitrificans]|uniref:Uncharacterized protein n=1 Tax=Roseobacter denitrificans (strain ATCC 33942 / OCh 114) TaxID=375451 RepID=Q162Y1_ROSDO|nr:hypothetical protein [Roseobacter denitrificans]ABG32962.1 hypothetical protein RD1_3477 [Roseobacter denitrificans OCh 114]AVL52348.1 hypothetical protein CEP88_06940 [Roseobacter denitrificans]SFG10426.1 hypothetical protein SAMN05443635_107181 [Roseobacter denitrificans OCh 114]